MKPFDNNPELLAKEARLDALRMIQEAGSSHIGSNFSIAEILATLYTRFLKIDPLFPKLESRDRFF